MTTATREAARIAAQNDAFRTTFVGGVVLLTSGVAALPETERAAILRKVRAFHAFTRENDPHGEHDFGIVMLGGEKFFWKIDLYDPTMQYGSEDPTNPEATRRVLTVMFASEY